MYQILNLKAKITKFPEENKRTTLCLGKIGHTQKWSHNWKIDKLESIKMEVFHLQKMSLKKWKCKPQNENK